MGCGEQCANNCEACKNQASPIIPSRNQRHAEISNKTANISAKHSSQRHKKPIKGDEVYKTPSFAQSFLISSSLDRNHTPVRTTVKNKKARKEERRDESSECSAQANIDGDNLLKGSSHKGERLSPGKNIANDADSRKKPSKDGRYNRTLCTVVGELIADKRGAVYPPSLDSMFSALGKKYKNLIFPRNNIVSKGRIICTESASRSSERPISKMVFARSNSTLHDPIGPILGEPPDRDSGSIPDDPEGPMEDAADRDGSEGYPHDGPMEDAADKDGSELLFPEGTEDAADKDDLIIPHDGPMGENVDGYIPTTYTFEYRSASFTVDKEWFAQYMVDLVRTNKAVIHHDNENLSVGLVSSANETINELWPEYMAVVRANDVAWQDVSSVIGCYNLFHGEYDYSDYKFWLAGWGAPHKFALNTFMLLISYNSYIKGIKYNVGLEL